MSSRVRARLDIFDAGFRHLTLTTRAMNII